MKTNILFLLIPILIVTLSFIPLLIMIKSPKKNKSKKNAKKLMLTHFLMFFGLIAISAIVMIMTKSTAYALETAKQVTENISGLENGLKYLSAAIATAISCIGAGIGVGNGISAAIGAYSENEKTFSKALMFVAFGEGIAIYGLVVSFLILFVA